MIFFAHVVTAIIAEISIDAKNFGDDSFKAEFFSCVDQVDRCRFDTLRQLDRIRNGAKGVVQQLPSDLKWDFK